MLPMRMFCGFPGNVPALPTLDAVATPIKKGIGEILLFLHITKTIGVKSRQTMSLIKKSRKHTTGHYYPEQ